ncbi:hypothetical protein NKH71_32340 [Mesorhizobium sp. M0983]|uniref:hypothetical protein n=1 Tax=Mesorhizobium sp. M0983 TaxID=2957040 RepID=UPI003338C92C
MTDREGDDAKATYGRQSDVKAANASQYHLAEASHRYHRGDHDHRQRHHERLVEACHNGWKGKRHLGFQKQLASLAPNARMASVTSSGTCMVPG